MERFNDEEDRGSRDRLFSDCSLVVKSSMRRSPCLLIVGSWLACLYVARCACCVCMCQILLYFYFEDDDDGQWRDFVCSLCVSHSVRVSIYAL